MPTLEAVREQALALPLAEREALIDELVYSLGTLSRDEFDHAWAAEAERRMDAYDRGELKAVTMDELKRELASE